MIPETLLQFGQGRVATTGVQCRSWGSGLAAGCRSATLSTCGDWPLGSLERLAAQLFTARLAGAASMREELEHVLAVVPRGSMPDAYRTAILDANAALKPTHTARNRHGFDSSSDMRWTVPSLPSSRRSIARFATRIRRGEAWSATLSPGPIASSVRPASSCLSSPVRAGSWRSTQLRCSLSLRLLAMMPASTGLPSPSGPSQVTC